jgi:hypothetical protein
VGALDTGAVEVGAVDSERTAGITLVTTTRWMIRLTTTRFFATCD